MLTRIVLLESLDKDSFSRKDARAQRKIMMARSNDVSSFNLASLRENMIREFETVVSLIK